MLVKSPQKGSSVFWQLEFRHRALSAYGILSIGILAYGILTMPLLACSILAISINWHIHITITAWTVNCVNDQACRNKSGAGAHNYPIFWTIEIT